MKFEEYAVQQAQNSQQPQEPQQAREDYNLERVAANLAADKLSSLLEKTREAIEEKTAPADLLRMITGELFGTGSTEAAAVDAILTADRHPGGYELSIANLRQQRRLLKQQTKALEEQARTIAEEIARNEAEERKLILEKSADGSMNSALVEIMAFCHTADTAQPDLLEQAERLYEKYQGNPEAAGLLLGWLVRLNRNQYAAGLDMQQQQNFSHLKARIQDSIKE